MSGLLDGMRSRAGEVMELLRSEQTAFLMVAAPNRIALSEGLYFHDRLADAGIPFRGFVINRVRPAAGIGKVPATPWEGGWPRSGNAEHDAAVEEVWAEHRRRARWSQVDRHHIGALRDHCGPGLPYVEIPEFEGEIHDLEALRLLLDYLG